MKVLELEVVLILSLRDDYHSIQVTTTNWILIEFTEQKAELKTIIEKINVQN